MIKCHTATNELYVQVKIYDSLRWPLEWMIKCHTATNELYVQVIIEAT